MDLTTAVSPHMSSLLPELRLRILSLLPPNDVVLGGRLSSKDAAQRFSEPHHRTVHLASQPLPGHVVDTAWCVEAARAATTQLTFRHKLLLLIRSPVSGCEANVEFMLQLMQQQLFPELLRTDHYLKVVPPPWRTWGINFTDLGSAAVASGLARLLPSLEQRCPGLLDPAATLQAASRHCDLAGLQAAWEVLGERMISTVQGLATAWRSGEQQVAEVLQCMLAAAADSLTADAVAKMDWVLDKGRVYGMGCNADVWRAAAASGDLARLQWLQKNGFSLSLQELLNVLMEHASLEAIQQLEQEGSFMQLPPPDGEYWSSGAAVYTAACSSTDSAAKLRWLVARGAALGGECPVTGAFMRSNMEALPLLWQHWREKNPDGPAMPASALASVTGKCSIANPDLIRMATWLHQVDPALLTPNFYRSAISAGDLPLLRWLLQAGCPHEDYSNGDVLIGWPAETPADCNLLVEAMQAVKDAGWPGVDPWGRELRALHLPWSVQRALMELGLLPPYAMYQRAFIDAPSTGCAALLEVLAEHPAFDLHMLGSAAKWYAAAATAGDLATLVCLRRLGVRLTAKALVAAIEEGAPLPALKWMADQGVHVGGRELREAAGKLSEHYRAPRERRRQAVEAWLKEQLEGEGSGGGGAAAEGE